MDPNQAAAALLLADHDAAIQASNLAPSKKSQIRRFYDGLSAKLAPPPGQEPSKAVEVAKSGGSLVLADLEGGAVGYAIAALEELAGDAGISGFKLRDAVAPAVAAGGAALALAGPALGIPGASSAGIFASCAASGVLGYKARARVYRPGAASVHGEDAELDRLAAELEKT